MTTRRKYPSDWAILAREIKAAANWTCEWCGMRFGENGWALEDQPKAHCGGDGRLKLLTVHHIDDNTFNNDWTNTLPCCQDCHLKAEIWKPGAHIPLRWGEVPPWIIRRDLPYVLMIQESFLEASR